VKGILDKDTMILLVNHWPSRRSGKEKSENKRIAVSIMVREIVDSVLQKNPEAKILLMGDFNDEPSDKSISIELNAKADLAGLKNDELYNPYYTLKNRGQGSVNYGSKWIMFDQILLSKGFFSGKALWEYENAYVYHPDWMHYHKDIHKGPYRTFMSDEYKGGYSDHFPVYIVLKKRY
jgi:exonuclease III